MGFGLYKPGQGYWVRVMTAAAIAIITFATAGWVMGQMAVLADKLPAHSWIADLDNAGARPEAGQQVRLLKASVSGAPAEVLGTAQVTSVTPGSASSTVTLGSFSPSTQGADPTSGVTIAPAADAAAAPNVKGTVRKVPPVKPEYLQFAAAGLALVIGALIAYFFAGVKPGTVEFLIATDMEMKKVNWSTRKDIMTSTWVVVGASFLLAGVLFGIDLAFQGLFKLIGILQQ